MSKSQRDKGANGERELCRILTDELGVEVARNLTQYQKVNQHDLRGIPFALEVKRQESLSLGTWWNQAQAQAEEAGLSPALAYRQSRQPWRFVVRMHDINQDFTGDCTATLELDGFVQLVRERL